MLHISSGTAALIDDGRLNEIPRIAGNADFMSRLMESFDHDISRLTKNLINLGDDDVLTAVPDTTHAIKGAAVGIGATRLVACCEEVDNLASAGQTEATRAAIARLCRCAEDTCVELRMRASVALPKDASVMH